MLGMKGSAVGLLNTTPMIGVGGGVLSQMKVEECTVLKNLTPHDSTVICLTVNSSRGKKPS